MLKGSIALLPSSFINRNGTDDVVTTDGLVRAFCYLFVTKDINTKLKALYIHAAIVYKSQSYSVFLSDYK